MVSNAKDLVSGAARLAHSVRSLVVSATSKSLAFRSPLSAPATSPPHGPRHHPHPAELKSSRSPSPDQQGGHAAMHATRYRSADDRPDAPEPVPAWLDDGPHGDPIADAVIWLAAFHGRSISRGALLAGLPVDDDKLPVRLIERAAANAGLEATLLKRAFDDIPALVLPCVVFLTGGRPRVLVGFDRARDEAHVVNPSTKAPATTVPLSTLAHAYLGFTLLAKPAAGLDPRVEGSFEIAERHWFWSVVAQFWHNYTHVAIAAFLVNVLALATPLFTMNVYDRVLPNGAVPSLVALAIGLGLAIIFDFILRTVRSVIIDMTGKQVDVLLAADIYDHVLGLKLANRPTSIGVLANQLRDFDSVREFFTSGTVVSITDLAFALLFIWVLFMIAGPMAWVPLLMLPLMLGIGFLLQRPLDRAIRQNQAETAARHGVLIEALAGIETIKAAGAEGRFQSRYEQAVAATARSSEKVHFWASLALTIASTAQQITTLAIMVIGSFLVMDGTITVGALVAATILSGRVLAPVAGIAALMTRATQTITALKSIDRLMQLERERPRGKRYVSRPIQHGRITFDGVSFQYPGTMTKALSNVTIDIKEGERVGVIGRVGSGKTTLGKIACALYEPSEGRILIDGVDSRQYDPADLRAGVGFVLQDCDLFFGTLRDNIVIGRPGASDEDMLHAARLAGVEAFAAAHPSGYDMMIAEGGRSLSGGQRQAISLARALIREPRILFLDEPTAHLDVRSEAEFVKQIEALHQRRLTLIVSTHRFSLLVLVERLVVIDNGRVVMDGPREAVLAKLRGPAGGAAPAGMRDA
jgi:ATP-binding cassette subfamily C protein LapB